MIDPSAQAFTANGIRIRGVEVTVQRISGTAPRTAIFSATIMGSVEVVQPDRAASERSGYGAGNTGALTQDDRQVVLMVSDLIEKRFPLPLRKNDRMLIGDDIFTIARVDPYKRAMAGALEATITGVP